MIVRLPNATDVRGPDMQNQSVCSLKKNFIVPTARRVIIILTSLKRAQSSIAPSMLKISQRKRQG